MSITVEAVVDKIHINQPFTLLIGRDERDIAGSAVVEREREHFVDDKDGALPLPVVDPLPFRETVRLIVGGQVYAEAVNRRSSEVVVSIKAEPGEKPVVYFHPDYTRVIPEK